MSNSFFINRWDVIQENGKNKAVIYIKPNERLMKYFRDVSDQVSVFIRGTKSPYEKGIFYARMVKPEDMYGYRPNLGTDELCLIMEAVWWGYPLNNLGIVDILQLEEIPIVLPIPTEKGDSIWLIIALLILLLIIFYQYNKRK